MKSKKHGNDNDDCDDCDYYAVFRNTESIDPFTRLKAYPKQLHFGRKRKGYVFVLTLYEMPNIYLTCLQDWCDCVKLFETNGSRDGDVTFLAKPLGAEEEDRDLDQDPYMSGLTVDFEQMLKIVKGDYYHDDALARIHRQDRHDYSFGMSNTTQGYDTFLVSDVTNNSF
jgi:hypothetical protein